MQNILKTRQSLFGYERLRQSLSRTFATLQPRANGGNSAVEKEQKNDEVVCIGKRISKYSKTISINVNSNILDFESMGIPVGGSGNRTTNNRGGAYMPNAIAGGGKTDNNPTITSKFTTELIPVKGFGVEFYTTKTIKEGSLKKEITLNGFTGKPESTTYKSKMGNTTIGTDGSFTHGNDNISHGTTSDGKYIFDFSFYSKGVTFYYNPDVIKNNLNYIKNLLQIPAFSPFILNRLILAPL